MTLPRPDIENFTDFRSFIREILAYRKTTEKYTFRKFAKDTGLSLGYVNMVTTGKRPLDAKHIPAFSNALQLDEGEEHFFTNLVELAGSTNAKDRSTIVKKLSRRKAFRDAFNLDRNYLDYLTHWHIGSILALVDTPSFDPSPDAIAAQLRPHITPTEADQAWQVLQDLNLVKFANGQWERSQGVLQTPDEGLNAELVKAYHLERIELMKWAIEHLAPEERNFGSITTQMTAANYQNLLIYMHEVRKNVVDFLDKNSDDDGDIIAHINWQTFLVSGSLQSEDNHE